jgi:hypothetical protein
MEKTKLQAAILCTLIWTNKGNLDTLAEILKKKGYIRSKNEFKNLFLKHSYSTIVKWNGDKLEHLAYLLYRLYSEGYFILKDGKGYFTCAEKHFTDYNGNYFKKYALKKLCWRVNNDITKYAFIHREIGEILSCI